MPACPLNITIELRTLRHRVVHLVDICRMILCIAETDALSTLIGELLSRLRPLGNIANPPERL